MPSVKLFRGQKWTLYVICRYSFMLHPKTFAPCPIPSTIWAIRYIICSISLMLCAYSYVTCGVWYVLCPVLYAMCPNPFMIYPFAYVACLNPCIMCLKIHVYASTHSWHGQKWHSLCKFLLCPVWYVVLAISFIHAQKHLCCIQTL